MPLQTWNVAETAFLLACVDQCSHSEEPKALKETLPSLLNDQGYTRSWSSISSKLKQLRGKYHTSRVNSLDGYQEHGSTGLTQLPQDLKLAMEALNGLGLDQNDSLSLSSVDLEVDLPIATANAGVVEDSSVSLSPLSHNATRELEAIYTNKKSGR